MLENNPIFTILLTIRLGKWKDLNVSWLRSQTEASL